MAHCLQFRERDMRNVSGAIPAESKTVDSTKQLTVAMFFIIFTQFLELQIPHILVRPALGIEIETNLVEHLFSFLIQFAFSEA
jgi:hypothetical protein